MKNLQIMVSLLLVFTVFCQNAYCLSPKLSLDKKRLMSTFENISDLEYLPARFLLHVRPLILLRHIAQMIKHQEHITILIRAVSDDGKYSIEFEQPLHQITNYAEVTAPFTRLSKFSHGVRIIGIAHHYELTFLNSTQEQVRPLHLIRFFKDFFARRITHENGGLIDVAFWQDDFDSKGFLLKADYLRIIQLLGYEHDKDYMFEVCGFKPQDEPSPKPKKQVFMDSAYLAKLDAYTPDYKNHGNLVKKSNELQKKADNTNLILSAV